MIYARPGCLNDLFENHRQSHRYVPTGVMSFHLPQIAVIADVISNPWRLDAIKNLFPAGQVFYHFECFQN
jgi:hypothetical protein